MPVIISIIDVYVRKRPISNVYWDITIYSVLSIIGIALAIGSWVTKRRKIPLIIGLLANIFVLACTFLLLFAMGMSEQ
ncbi:hypothetical protein P4562_16275 [Lysinibacillus xylanilyticus]|uniref:hypothetical protein n=1 Tax=Lysinibacillus xylanilyticus TaxID=582475 RepID=UPI002E1F57CE|nr:hypothetical protein [Lysinibacillus xylanilyticus]